MENKNISNKLDDFLNNEKMLRDVKTTTLLVLVVLIPILYFGFKDTIKPEMLFSFDFGVASIIGIILNKVVVKDFKNRAFYDVKNNNEELLSTDKEINKLSQNFNDIDKCIEFVKIKNNNDQERANKLVTNEKINKLKNKIRSRKLKGKRYKRYQRKLDFLQDNLLVDKKYKPINLNTLISKDNSFRDNNILGDKAVNYDPKKDKWYSKLTIIFKFFGFGAGGLMFLFLIEDKIALVLFILLLVVTISITSIFKYSSVRRKTSTIYLRTRQNKLKLMEEMRDYKVVEEVAKNEKMEISCFAA